MAEVVSETHLNFPNRRQGKVRDLYDIDLPDGDAGLLIVATDRISAFDVVLGTGLPSKGIVLTQISRFWFDYFVHNVQHHLVSTDVNDLPNASDIDKSSLEGRIMICRRGSVIPVECIARGYITGSGYKDYLATGRVCGIELPHGLRNSDRLSEPLFTPSTKADVGEHDENISFDEGANLVGIDTMTRLRDTTLDLYTRASEYALSKGIILADTKFEFAWMDGSSEPVLIDEIFTPDSSRFWPADEWAPGREQNSFDKQIVRNYLESIVAKGKWDKTPPGPILPNEVVAATMNRYLEAYELLTGLELSLS